MLYFDRFLLIDKLLGVFKKNDSYRLMDFCRVSLNELQKQLIKKIADKYINLSSLSFDNDMLITLKRSDLLLLANNILNVDSDLKRYLQSRLHSYKLDIGYFYCTKYSGLVHRQSLMWHHDSVGNRVKIFIPIFYNGTDASLYIEKQTMNQYKPPLYGVKRNDYKPRNEIISLGADTDFAFAFDTNSMHSGNSYIESGVLRIVLVIEASNILKSLFRYKSRVGMRSVP
jgi:hypothetical protein